ncbi:MAG: ribbon-helix-helix protein, CopG family [Acidimicrobiia bacterium]
MKYLSFRCSPKLCEVLDHLARVAGVSRSDYIRTLILSKARNTRLPKALRKKARAPGRPTLG